MLPVVMVIKAGWPAESSSVNVYYIYGQVYPVNVPFMVPIFEFGSSEFFKIISGMLMQVCQLEMYEDCKVRIMCIIRAANVRALVLFTFPLCSTPCIICNYLIRLHC